MALRLAVLLGAALACAASVEERRESARALHAEGRYEESLVTLAALLDQDPGDPELNHLYGVALLQTAKVGMAVWPLRRAAESPEYAVEDGLLLVRALLRGTLPDENAVTAVNRVLELEPGHLGALALRAGAQLRLKRHSEVLADAERILAEEPAHIQALLWRVKALAELERFDEAEAALAQSRERIAGRPQVENLGPRLCGVGAELAQARQDRDEATRRWEACLDAFPGRPELVAEALRFFDEQGEGDRAEALLRASIAAAPATLSFRTQLARRLDADGDTEQAASVLREAAEQGLPRAWHALAELHRAHSDYAAAMRAMEEVLKRAPAVPPLFLAQYGDDLVNLGEFAAADVVIDRLTDPRLAELLAGRSLLSQGDPTAALERLESGLRLWPGNPTGRWLAARAAEQLGDFDRAIAEYRNSVRANPGHTDAALRLAQIYDAEGSDGDALLMLGHRMRAKPDDAQAYVHTIRIASRARRSVVVSDALAKLAALPGQAPTALLEAAAVEARRVGPRAAVHRIERSAFDLRSPDHAPLLRALVEHLAVAGRGTEATRYTRAAIDAYPESAALHEVHARALEVAASPAPEIRGSLERSLAIEAERPTALLALARRAALDGRTAEALALYDGLKDNDEHGIDAAWAAIELLEESSGQRSEIVPRLEALLEREPIHAAGANRLARRLLEGGEELARAEALAARALRFGADAPALDTLGRVALAQGDSDRALRTLRRSLELEPNAPSVLYHLALALQEQGQVEEADAALRAALALGSFPEAVAARQQLARIEEQDRDG